jgi:hypothetical protein
MTSRNIFPTAQWVEHPHINVRRVPAVTDFEGPFVGLGSCFAMNVKAVIEQFGFDFWFNRGACAHYSTESMANLLEGVASGGHTEKDLHFEERDQVIAYRHYFKKRFHGPRAVPDALDAMLAVDRECFERIAACRHLVITLGTARVVRMNESGALINSVAGIDSKYWHSQMLSVEDNVRHLERVHSAVLKIRGGVAPTIFLTISPQRYLFVRQLENVDDAFVDNMLSKSILRVAVAEFLKRHPDASIYYFPAYEFVIDELRQLEPLSHYDFTHIEQRHTPEYVVKRFLQAYCTNDVLRQLELIERVHDEIVELQSLIESGMPTNADEIVKPIMSAFDTAEGLGTQLSPMYLLKLRTILDLLWDSLSSERGAIVDFWQSANRFLQMRGFATHAESRAKTLNRLKLLEDSM